MRVQGANSRLAVGDITLHLTDVDFSMYFVFVVPSIHLQIHDMFGDSLHKSAMSMTTLGIVRIHSLGLLLHCVRLER